MSSAPAKRPSLPGLFLSVLGAGLPVSIIGALVIGFDLAPGTVVYAAMGLVIGAVAMGLSWRWWAKTDEAVREAHKTSWYWGGSVGLVVVSVIAMPLFAISADLAPPAAGLTRGEAGFMLAGVILTVVLLLLGYVVCWAGWWLSRGR